MGRLIAAALHARGARVTLLEGSAATSRLALPDAVVLKSFFLYDELDAILTRELRRGYDIVIQAAAVPDLRPARLYPGKMPSGRGVCLKLVPTKKLIDKVRRIAPRCCLVGFKLAARQFSGRFPAAVKGLFERAGCDLVVANAVTARGYRACLFGPRGRLSPDGLGKGSLVKVLIDTIDR